MHENLTWTLMLLLLSGVLCNEWKVQYAQKHICAVRGSLVVIPCSFYYPNSIKVQSVKWAHQRNNIYTGPFILDSESNKTISKYQYTGDRIHNCSLKINQVEHNDTGQHYFRFTTSQSKGYTGRGGSMLKVVDLNISVTTTSGNETVKEGDSVKLICINACDRGGLSSAFTWFQDGEVTNEGPVLSFSNISSPNSGNYTCSLKMQRGTTSEATHIDVEYGPKNTSVSVRPSAEVSAGHNITLICSTNANPTVKNYTWFKVTHDIVTTGHGPKLYFSEIHPRDGGQYFCSVSNNHGHQESSIVSLKVNENSSSFIRDVLIVASVAALLIGTSVIAIRCLGKNRSAQRTSQETDDTQNTIYVNWPVFENSQSQVENHSEDSTKETRIPAEAIYASIDFSSIRKLKMQQQVDSHNDPGDVVYSTVCRAPC